MKKILTVSMVFVAITILFSTSGFAASAFIQPSFSTNPTTIAPGSDGILQLTLKNAGTAVASNIKVDTISYDPFISVSSSGIGSLGSVDIGGSTIALFKVSVLNSAPSGLYTVRFSITYCTDSSCTEIDPTAVITVQTPSALEIISVDPSTLAAGQTTVLNFNLANQGTNTLSNIILSWQMPNNEILPLGTSNRQFIASLNGGSSMIIPVNVSVGSSVSPGVYPMTIKVEYFDKSGTKQNASSLIGIKIGGTTDFDVGVQQYSAGTVSLSVANIGVNPATSVSISVPQQNNFAISGASSVFIGNLNAGDFTVANFQVSPRAFTFRNQNPDNPNPTNTTSGENPANTLNVEIAYTDTSGARQLVQKQITVDFGSAQNFQNTSRNRNGGFMTIIYVVVAVIAAAAVFALWFFKFRKKKNKKLF